MADAGRLAHVRWIGGGSGAGKTTVARALAAAADVTLYEVEPLARFAARADPTRSPRLQAFMAMDMDERWVQRTPQAMLETFHAFQGEGFDLVVEDLLALPRDRLVVVEGFALLPRLVAPLLARRTDAVWLLPTPDFRRRAFAERGSTWTIAKQTRDPERALANLLERDRRFNERLRAETGALDLATIAVDGTRDAAALTRAVADALGLPLRPILGGT